MNSVTPSRTAEGKPVAVPASGASPNVPAAPLASYPPPQPPSPRDDVDDWADKAEKALAAARTARSSEAWRQAGKLSLIVADVALAVEAELAVSHQADMAARKAEELAREAEAALRFAQRATSTARDMRDAVARARSSGTAESWQVAARVAAAIVRAPDADSDHDEDRNKEAVLAPVERGTVTQINPASWPTTPRRRTWDTSTSDDSAG